MNFFSMKFVFAAAIFGLMLGLMTRRLDATYSYWCDISFHNGTTIDGYTSYRPNGSKLSISTANRDYILALNLPNFTVANYTKDIELATMTLSNFRATNDESAKALIHCKKHTIALIKPHILQENKIGEIIKKIQENGFKITELNTVQFTINTAQKFYSEHVNKTFFNDLVNMMTESPSIRMELEADEAVPKWRSLMADLRKKFAKNPTENALHGSDSVASYFSEHVIVKTAKQTADIAKTKILVFGENVGEVLINLEKQYKISALNLKNMNFDKFTKFKNLIKDSEYIKVGEQKAVWTVEVDAETSDIEEYTHNAHIDNVVVINNKKTDL